MKLGRTIALMMQPHQQHSLSGTESVTMAASPLHPAVEYMSPMASFLPKSVNIDLQLVGIQQDPQWAEEEFTAQRSSVWDAPAPGYHTFCLA